MHSNSDNIMINDEADSRYQVGLEEAMKSSENIQKE